MATTGGGPRGPGSSYTRAARTLTPRLPASARSRLDRFAAPRRLWSTDIRWFDVDQQQADSRHRRPCPSRAAALL